MNEIERYEFDRLGYLHVSGMLEAEEITALTDAIDRLEQLALPIVQNSPRKSSWMGASMNCDHHFNESLGIHVSDFGTGLKNGGPLEDGHTLVVEDFFNADPAFDLLVNHQPTMDHITSMIQGPIRINNSELRFRNKGNATVTHMGGPIDHKYRYGFNQDGIDAMMVRVIYFVHDVTREQGAFCVVPATHKSNYPSPYGGAQDPDNEPGMIALEAKAGDVIFFTEHLRHGGFLNKSDQVRKTLHVGYGPTWMMSQNVATVDEPQFILKSTLDRYDADQRALFVRD